MCPIRLNEMRDQFDIPCCVPHRQPGDFRGAMTCVTLTIALLAAGCSSSKLTQPQQPVPAATRTTTASLQNDPYPELRQLSPEEAKRVTQGRALVSQLRGSGPGPNTVPQAPLTPGQIARANDQTTAQQQVPRQPAPIQLSGQQAQPQPRTAIPPAQAQAPRPPAANQLASPPPAATRQTASVTKVEPEKRKKSNGFFSFLSPISSRRVNEESPAQKLRRSRRVLATQSRALDNTQIANVTPGASGVVQPGTAPVKNTAALRPSLARPKPVTRTASVKPRRVRTAPVPKRVPRPKVVVAQLDAPERSPATTASVPGRNQARTRNRAFNPSSATSRNVQPGPTVAAATRVRSAPITVYFAKGSAALTSRAASRLRTIASQQKAAGRRVHVRAIAAAGPNGDGVSDSNALNNLAVSRAKSVASKLWAYGVKTDKMVLKASQEQVAGRSRSTLQASRIRRVEVYLE